jgi:hypothetical protein
VNDSRALPVGLARLRSIAGAIAGAIGVALLVACGGGGVGTGGTGAFASGPITGFGSIIVNEVHYDDSLARVEADDGSARSRDDLQLGMVVEVESDAVRDNAAVAQSVRIVSERIGRVDAVGSASLVVNGLTVRVNAGTVYDPALTAGLAGLPVGAVVEVYGFSTGATGEVVATRIEPRPGASRYKFRGTLSMLDTQARTFRIGSQVFIHPAQIAGRDQLANGALLRILVEPQRDSQQRWLVTSINGGTRPPADGQDVKTNGLITLFTSLADFQVGAWRVDASAAEIDDGPLALGQRVKVEGFLRGGVLVASEVRVVGQDGDDDYETKGRIVAIDPVARVFQLNGNRGRVGYARNDLVIEGGTLAMLAVGRRVSVSGELSADGTLLDARRIEFDDDDDDDDDDKGDDED